MAEALHVGRVYLRLVRGRVRSQLQYRFSFALQLVGTTLIALLDFVAILVLFAHVPALGGWSVEEVALLYAIASIAFALTDLVVGHLDLFPTMIRDGTFDLLLVRPLPSLLQVIASDFSLRRLGKAFQGVAVLAVAVTQLEIDWTFGRAAVIPLAVLAGAVIYGAVWVALATIAFWIVDAIEFVNAFTYGGNFLSQYPLNIFASWLRGLVVFVLPIGFVAYFPSLYVLDKPDPLGFPAGLQFASPLVAAVSAVVAVRVWGFAVRHYRSAGG